MTPNDGVKVPNDTANIILNAVNIQVIKTSEFNAARKYLLYGFYPAPETNTKVNGYEAVYNKTTNTYLVMHNSLTVAFMFNKGNSSDCQNGVDDCGGFNDTKHYQDYLAILHSIKFMN